MVEFGQEELLRKVAELTEENNAMLQKLYRAQVISNVMRVVYWVVIIVLFVGSFFFIRPFISQTLSTYGDLLGIHNSADFTDQLLKGLE